MSKRVSLRLKARRAGDVPALMKAIVDAASDDVDLDLHIDHEPTKQKPKSRTRKDEKLETMVSGEAGLELDRLAQAAEEFKFNELRDIQESAQRQIEKRSSIRAWVSAMAKAGWETVVKVAVESWIKGGGTP